MTGHHLKKLQRAKSTSGGVLENREGWGMAQKIANVSAAIKRISKDHKLTSQRFAKQ
jgi:hypothetical protein